jgi:alpha-galactosidase
MAIRFDETTKTITLDTANTTYQMAVGKFGYLLHLYYGKKTAGNLDYLLQYYDRAFAGNPSDAGADRTFSLDVLPQEYPCYGDGDFRTSAFSMKDSRGVYGCDLRYQSHRIEKGKYAIPGLPAVYAAKQEADTLTVTLADPAAGVEVTLYYGVLAEQDVITRAACIRCTAKQPITVTRAFSGCVDWLYGDYDVIHFPGRHGMERNPVREAVTPGTHSFGSLRGTSSHQQNPFVIVAGRDANEDSGECFGMALLYSGNFRCAVEQDQFRQTRALMGVQDEMFEYTLAPGEVFRTPELACCYSANGLTALSQRYHRLILDHVCRGPYQHKRRPILINSWEAAFFDFNKDTLLNLARQASELGVEMLVLDDGWFGKRDSDDSGLGDWVVNEKKLGCPLSEVADGVNKLGMKFGLWIEPEMVSEDSDLYRAHPDWAFRIPGRTFTRGRNQLVLDFSRREVVDSIFAQISKVIDAAHIEYVKMDMNRSITDVYSAVGQQNNGAILYKYVLGVYDFLQRLLDRYPEMLIEGCSGGGGRFDAGMLYYTPQIWCSDDSDAVERIKIQYGSSFCYPIAAMGAHVSVVPNQQTGRTVPIATRAAVAMAGTFGYELDLSLLSGEEKQQVRAQVLDCKKYWDLIHEGLFYRLTDVMQHPEFAAWQIVAQNGADALLSVVTLDTHCNPPLQYVRLKGLKPEAVYRAEDTGKQYTGSALMNAGLPLPWVPDEYQTWQVHLIRE